MDIFSFIRILIKKWKYLVSLPLLIGTIVFMLTADLPVEYSTEATIFTGITSNTGIENMENSRVDFFATKNAYNNILSILRSKSVLKETSLRLLTMHLLLEKPTEGIIDVKAFEELQKIVPHEIKTIIVKNDFEKTLKNIENSIQQDNNNFVYGLLHHDHPHYSLKALANIKSVQIESSDLIQISYKSNDPGICYHSVKILTEVFIRKYNLLKQRQTGSAVAYFEKQLHKAAEKLKDSEDKLLLFNTSNNIINYYEQTKHVSSQQEKIEVKLQEIKMEFNSAKAVLSKLENETNKRFDINLRNKEILKLREELIAVNEIIAKAELNKSLDTTANTHKTILEKKLKNKIDSMYVYESNSQGIELKKILEEWLSAVTEFESTKARLATMQDRKIEFMKQYQRYAPQGANLKRIEREIDVNEREYLEILHHLGLARLKQQNAEMLSDMKVLDKPQLPISAMASKRKLYVIVAALFCIILFSLGLFVLELLDRRIKTPAKLEEMSGLKVISAFCDDYNKDEYHRKITNQAIGFLHEKIHENETGDTPILIQIVSNLPKEGKTFLCEILNGHFNSIGYCSKVIEGTRIKNKEKPLHAKNYFQFLREDELKADILLVNVESLSEGIFNPTIFKSADMTFLIADSRRIWTESDNFLISKTKELLNDKLYAVLTKASADNLESLYGEIPKQRSFIRKFMKKKVFNRFV